MVQLARIFFPGSPHLVTQRGNRREMVFFEPDDYRAYLELLAEATRKAETQVWAYCPMPNHVHLILLPRHGDSLRVTLADTHRQHTRRINARKQWTGHLWQGRFSSVTMDEGHLASAERYVSLNPVREGLVGRSADWPWSSVTAHLSGREDALAWYGRYSTEFPNSAACWKAPRMRRARRPCAAAETVSRPLDSET